jgi:hypothetical protein
MVGVLLMPYASACICTNACTYSDDYACDDGGPDSLYSLCEYGSDCLDCGERCPSPPVPPAMSPFPPFSPGTVIAILCWNNCTYSSDDGVMV